MKFGYMIDSPLYDPRYIEADSFSAAVKTLEKKLLPARLVRDAEHTPYIEIWPDKGIERRDMSFSDLKQLYKLSPSKDGLLKSYELCKDIWDSLLEKSSYVDKYGRLQLDTLGFIKGTDLEGIYDWLDARSVHEVKSLIVGPPGRVLPDKPYLPCQYVSVWSEHGTLSSVAKYDPIENKLYDVENQDIYSEAFVPNDILADEFMVLLGCRFKLHEMENNDTWKVQEPDPLYVLFGTRNILENSRLDIKERDENMLSSKSILDCELERDIDSHNEENAKIVEFMEGNAPYGGILKASYKDLFHKDTPPEYIFIYPDEYQNILESFDLKNGVDFTIENANLAAIVYGQNYRLMSTGEVHMVEAAAEYRFFKDEDVMRKIENSLVLQFGDVNSKEAQNFLETLHCDMENFMDSEKLIADLKAEVFPERKNVLSEIIKSAEERKVDASNTLQGRNFER